MIVYLNMINDTSDSDQWGEVSLWLGLGMCSKCSLIRNTFIIEILFPLFHLWFWLQMSKTPIRFHRRPVCWLLYPTTVSCHLLRMQHKVFVFLTLLLLPSFSKYEECALSCIYHDCDICFTSPKSLFLVSIFQFPNTSLVLCKKCQEPRLQMSPQYLQFYLKKVAFGEKTPLDQMVLMASQLGFHVVSVHIRSSLARPPPLWGH